MSSASTPLQQTPVRSDASAATGTDPTVALCERVRALARKSGQDALQARQQDASKLVAEARRQAEAECQAELLQARKRLDQQKRRELQNVRLETRARLARARWSLLDGVLDEALRSVSEMRAVDPARYVAVLDRFLRDARHLLAVPRVVVQLNPRDLCPLREYLKQTSGGGVEDEAVNLVESADVDAGLRAGTPEGDTVSDQIFAARRERLNEVLRLVIAEVLFGDGRGKSAETEGQA